MKPISIFESTNFSFRLLDAEDENLFCDVFTDKTTMMLIGPALSEEAAATLYRSAQRANLRQPNRDLYYAIRCKRTDDEIGICTLQRIDWVSRCAEVGLMLRPEKQHRGLGPEILQGLVRSAFDGFGFDRLHVSYHAENLAAKRLFAACGFAEMPCTPYDVASQPKRAMLTAQEWRTENPSAEIV